MLFLVACAGCHSTATPETTGTNGLPPGFVHVDELVPNVVVDLRYFGSHNFVGARIDGYEAPRAILTRRAAEALAAVEKELSPFGFALEIFDAYRPQRAVDHFVRWAQDLHDTKTKAEFYPHVAKKDLFREEYIAERSGHTRGSTVDLTILRTADGAELDMGTSFDYFGPESWPEYDALNAEQRAHRLLLRTLMTKHGFRPYEREWWHFTLENEPFPETYFDFPVR